MKIQSLIRKKFLAVALLMMVMAEAQSQYATSGYFNQANQLFAQKQYYEAAQVYEKYLLTEKKSRPRATVFAVEKKVRGKSNLNPHQGAVYQLAECYRLNHDYIHAEKWYKEATGFANAAYPLCQYWYGVTLRTNQKYTEAFEALTKFVESYKELDPIMRNADRELDNIKFILAQNNKARKDQFILQQQNFGSLTSHYAMSVMHEDTLVFTGIHSQPPKTKDDKETFSNALYETLDGEDLSVQATSLTVNSPANFQQGLATFSSDGQKIFFTRWNVVNGLKRSEIFSSDRLDSGWSDPKRLDDAVNVSGYNNAQPFLSSDDKFLFFSSDRPGGFGKFDIWVANLDEQFNILTVTNLGASINTPDDEESPFYHSASRTLVFSSNGRVGMGGFDIYYATNDFSFTRWSNPVNPGSPINSTKDDLYYLGTDKENLWNTGWLSSDRASNCCLALFSVRENAQRFIYGKVVDCKTGATIPGAELTLTDPVHKNKLVGKIKTDSAGQYGMSMANISKYQVYVQKEGYESAQNLYRVHLETGVDTSKNEPICLNVILETKEEKIVKGVLAELSKTGNLGNFEYKKATLTSTTNTNLDSLANLMKAHPSIVVQIGGYTDGIGGEQYNLRLAQARVNTCIHYLVKKGINPARLKGKAFGKCCPIAPETIDGKDNPAGREKNRRVEFTLLVGEDGTGAGAIDPRKH
jgi:outer membrane protein OmpA-like peptidoglycan-associated protein/tetratricopeptide (TPR) repeat protein